MTDAEILEKQAEAAKEKKAAIKKRKEEEVKAGFLNPFGEGTSYKEFLAAVKSAKVDVKEYCKGKLTEDQLSWLEQELSILNDSE